MNLTDLEKKYGLQKLGNPRDSTSDLRKIKVPWEHTEDGLGTVLNFADAVGEEVGIVGTRVTVGRIAIEPSASFRPYYVRGTSGNPRLYEEYWRSDNIIFDSYQSSVELLLSGRYDLTIPEDAPEEDRERLEEFAAFYKSKFLNIKGGWDKYVEEAASSLLFGFAPFEVVWARDAEGRPYPHKIAFREQNTVERWLFCERGDQLDAGQFQTGGDTTRRFTLTAHGARVEDHKLLIANVNARGNNVEGISLLRPIIHWVRLKRILIQIAGVCAEKYGVPIVQIFRDPAYANEYGLAPDDDQKKDLRAVYGALRSVESAAIEMPDGLRAELLAPPGTMPNLQTLLEFCDQQIARVFSNEGSLLGRNQIGSYALGEVKERDFIRSAPFFARRILKPINDLIRVLARDWFGDDVPDFIPQMRYILDAFRDSSRWIQDVNSLMPNGQWRDVPEVAEQVFKELGIDVPKAKNIAVETGSKGQAGASQKVADSALNGAQVGSMVSIITQVAQGMLPAKSAVAILQKAFLLPEREARLLVNPAENFELPKEEVAAPRTPRVATSMADVGEDEPKETRSLSATSLGKSFADIADKHKTEYSDRVGPLVDPDKIQTESEEIEKKFRPLYIAAALAGAEDAAQSAAQEVADQLGIEPALIGTQEQSTQLQAKNIGEQAFSRTQGFLTEQKSEQLRATQVDADEAPEFEFKRLADRTFGSIGDKAIVAAVMSGRDRTINAVTNPSEGEPKTVIAIRRDASGIDSCGPCKALDGYRAIYGSTEYLEYTPPNKCRGRNGCTCFWEYAVDEGST